MSLEMSLEKNGGGLDPRDSHENGGFVMVVEGLSPTLWEAASPDLPAARQPGHLESVKASIRSLARSVGAKAYEVPHLHSCPQCGHQSPVV